MEGKANEAFENLLVKNVGLYTNGILTQYGLSDEQALDIVTKLTGFPKEKVFISLNRFGNTSSSSIPISLVDQYGESDNEQMINALCCGFGVGLSWSTVALPINVKDIFPLVHTDEYFSDGYNLDDQE